MTTRLVTHDGISSPIFVYKMGDFDYDPDIDILLGVNGLVARVGKVQDLPPSVLAEHILSVLDMVPNKSLESLRDDELEYIRYLTEGFKDQEIADRMGLSIRAIKNKKRAIASKTGCATITEAVHLLVKHNVLNGGTSQNDAQDDNPCSKSA